jgi:hypothetical protein
VFGHLVLVDDLADLDPNPVRAGQPASLAMAGARRQVIQLSPPSSRRASIRAEVIIPRSPTKVSSRSPNLTRTSSTASVNAVGSAVLPGKTRIATGRPCRSVSSPYSIWSLPLRPSRE